MRERLKSLSFAASLALGVPVSLLTPLLLPQGHAIAGVFDKDEDIDAESRRLSRDLGDDSHPRTRVAGIFGESDEEKAAAEAARQRENAQDSGIQSLNQRVQDLENTVRRLTGQNEQLSHQVDELHTALDRAHKDFDYRLCTMSAQQLGATDQGDGGLNCGAAGQQGSNISAPPPAQRFGSAVDSNSEYNSAMQLLARARYDEARGAFRSFADNHPDDMLTPQAVYWVGDIAYVQKDYTGAARAFAEQIKKYPQSSRAPDSMLKLGQSLIAMGQKQEGCTTLGAIKAKYPQASDTILATAKSDRKAASCR